jgi:hypothetical protein
MELLVVVTAPHSKCPKKSKKRECDTVSGEAADTLVKYLQINSIKTKLFKADILRKECDLNRFPCRTKSFRPDLTRFVENNKNKYKIVVLDIHSFPNIYKSFSYNHVMYILDDNKKFAHYSTSLNKYIKKMEYQSTLIRGKYGENDIVVEMESQKVDAMLIEFNEQWFGVVGKRLCSFIVSWITKYYIAKRRFIGKDNFEVAVPQIEKKTVVK